MAHLNCLDYIFYRLKLTAPMLDFLGLGLSLIGFSLIYRAKEGEVGVPLLGILLVCLHVFLDFVDTSAAPNPTLQGGVKAPLSINPEHIPAFRPESRRVDGSVHRGKEESSRIGHELDKIGCEIDRVLLLTILAFFTENPIIIFINLFSAIMIFSVVQPTWDYLYDSSVWVVRIKSFYKGPFSLNSVSIMLGILLFSLGMVISFRVSLVIFSYVVSLTYFISILGWFLLIFAGREKVET